MTCGFTVVLTASLSNNRLRPSNRAQEILRHDDHADAATAPTRRASLRQVQARLTERHELDLVAAYRSGSSMNDLAAAFKIHRRTVRAVLTRHGVETRTRGLTDDQVSEAARLYEAGWSVARLGERYGVNGTTVWTCLRREGVALRRPWEQG